MPDYECTEINIRLKEIKENWDTPKIINHVTTELKSNLYSLIIINIKGSFKLLKKAKSNNRRLRIRPETNEKSQATIIKKFHDKPV